MNKEGNISVIVPEAATSAVVTSRMSFCRLILEISFEQLL
jgi:hypothetical protein